nr:glycoside hydrolase family 2 TIM barrel-domain containing protein [uncultured Arsenicibacter sp.]
MLLFRKLTFAFLLCVLVYPLCAQYAIRQPNAVPLHGEWLFALDPANMGETGKWFADNQPTNRWDKVTVPHCFSVDRRYQFYTGKVWYRRTFPWQPAAGKRVLLHFDASFHTTTIYLNNQKISTHEGGYTPFHVDVTGQLKAGDNLLVVSVDNNTWKPGSIPGSKDNNQVNDPFMGWINYGGLIRPVYLTTEADTYLENLKVETVPDLAKGTATVRVRARIRNASGQSVSPKLVLNLAQQGRPVTATWKMPAISIPAGQTALLDAETALKAADVKLWGLDTPNLYNLTAAITGDTLRTRFGIRKVEVKGIQLLLNGQPIKAAGGNRVVDYPGLGSLEPEWLVEKDFRLMKEAGMELHRLTHYTPSESIYDWADENGMLIITEAGNWQLTPRQMDNDTIRDNFRQQFREMAQRDWNHPCVIAYSVGNEYLSEQPAGQRWTKDMIAFARELDPTRLYTFASMRLNILPKKPEDEASQYCDFVSTNTYGNHLNVLKHIHSLYPDKPIFISEYGTRADGPNGEAAQVTHLDKFLSDVRQLPYVIGASWWSFNDYQSRHHGTNPNGYRPWGLVGPERELRPLYKAHQSGMAPLTIEKVRFEQGPEGVHKLTVRITARNDFPAYALKGYRLRAGQPADLQATSPTRKSTAGELIIPDLQPGQSTDLSIPVQGFDKTLTIDISKPTGFHILSQQVDLTNDTRTSNR